MDSYYTSTVLGLARPERASGMKSVKNKLLHDQGIQSSELCPFYYILRKSPVILFKHLNLLLSLTLKVLKYFFLKTRAQASNQYFKHEVTVYYFSSKRMKYQYSVTAQQGHCVQSHRLIFKNEWSCDQGWDIDFQQPKS